MRYVIVMVFLGGLLVLFVYISSLVPNQYEMRIKFSFFLLVWLCLFFVFDYFSVRDLGFRVVTGGEVFYMLYRGQIFVLISFLLVYLLFVLVVVYRLT